MVKLQISICNFWTKICDSIKNYAQHRKHKPHKEVEYDYNFQKHDDACELLATEVIFYVIIANVHFWNYYVPLRTYVRKLSFNHFGSNVLARLLLIYPLNFLSGNPHNCHFSFCGGMTTRRKARCSLVHSAPQPENRHGIVTPPHLPLITHQGNIHYALLNSALPHDTGGMFPLCSKKYFLHTLTLFFLCYLCDPPRSPHPLKAVTWQMGDHDKEGGIIGYTDDDTRRPPPSSCKEGGGAEEEASVVGQGAYFTEVLILSRRSVMAGSPKLFLYIPLKYL